MGLGEKGGAWGEPNKLYSYAAFLITRLRALQKKFEKDKIPVLCSKPTHVGPSMITKTMHELKRKQWELL